MANKKLVSNLDNIYSWSRSIGSRLLRQDYITGKYQDDALHPENYIDQSTISQMLGTPTGNRWIKFKGIDPFKDEEDAIGEINEKPVELSRPEFILENPIITINRPKEIVQTSVNGLNGKIVEIVSNGNFEINIVGTLAGVQFWNYDEANIKNLETIFQVKKELMIDSPYLNDIFDITKIAITDHKIAQSTEFTNVTAIEINCISILNEDIFEIDEDKLKEE